MKRLDASGDEPAEFPASDVHRDDAPARLSAELSAMTDERLFERYRKRQDRRALEILAARKQDTAHRLAYHVCRNASCAEEAVQEAFILLLRPQCPFVDRGQGSFVKWFHSVVINSARVHRRGELRNKQRLENAKFLQNNEEMVESKGAESVKTDNNEQQEMRLALNRALDGLREDLRLTLSLHFLDGLSQEDVGRTLNISRQMVQRRIDKGLLLLRRRLSAQGLAVGAGVLTTLLRETTVPALSPAFVALPAKIFTLSADVVSVGATHSARVGGLSTGLKLVPMIFGALLVAAAVVGAHFYWNNRPAARSASAESSATTQSAGVRPFSVSWNFDDRVLPKEIVPSRGKWSITNDDSADTPFLKAEPLGDVSPQPKEYYCTPDGTLHLANNFYAVAGLQIPDLRPPLLITFRAAVADDLKHPDHMAITAMWNKYKAISTINGFSARRLGALHGGSPRTWWRIRIYVTNRAVFILNDDRPNLISMEEPQEGATLLLVARGTWHLDDLSVRALSEKEVPVEEIEAAIEAAKKQYGEYARHSFQSAVPAAPSEKTAVNDVSK